MAGVEKTGWGYAGGRQVFLYSLFEEGGLSCEVTNYGCRIRSLRVPSPAGLREVVLGYETLDEYINDPYMLGACVGPVTDRIRGGEFMFDGNVFRLDKNAGDDCIHSGGRGFQHSVWNASERPDGLCLTLDYSSGDFGFPGQHTASVSYTLVHKNTLRITYRVSGSAPGVFSPTNHSYFNLLGGGSVKDHRLTLYADTYAEQDARGNSTGKTLIAEGVMDMSQPAGLGRFFEKGGGLDDFFFIKGEGFRKAAELCCPGSPVRMECWTDRPGVLAYTANSLEAFTGRGGVAFTKQSAVCLETQCLPNAVKLPEYEKSVRIPPSSGIRTVTEYRFYSDVLP